MEWSDLKLGWIVTAFNLFIGVGGYLGIKKKNLGRQAVISAEQVDVRKRVRVHGKRLRKLEDTQRDMTGKVSSIDARTQEINHDVRNMNETLIGLATELRRDRNR